MQIPKRKSDTVYFPQHLHQIIPRSTAAKVYNVYLVSNDLPAISDVSHGLIQIIADNFDNFDADISSQNRKVSTHSLAFIVTQTNTNTDAPDNQLHSIKRISKTDMQKDINYNVSIERYYGPQKHVCLRKQQ